MKNKNMGENFPDDILLEIFIRLPNCRSIIRCSSVCRRWRSLITRNSKLLRRTISEFNQPQSYTHLIGKRTTLTSGPEKISRATYHELSLGRGPEPQITTLSETRLDFLPWPQEEIKIRASFRDLLLVSLRDDNREYCVCNIFTKQAVRLPRAPANSSTEWGLFFESKSCNKRHGCNCDVRYKVVLINSRRDQPRARIFCSETRVWTKINLRDRWESEPKLNGSCWIGILGDFLLTFDPFETPCEQSSLIPLPNEMISRSFFYVSISFVGIVNGRLRLSQITWAFGGRREVIRIWELNPAANWFLVHRVELELRGDQSLVPGLMYAFHPNDGKKIFVNCVKNGVCIYNIFEKSVEQVGRIPELHEDLIGSVTNHSDFFALHHSSIPTLIPSLSNFN